MKATTALLLIALAPAALAATRTWDGGDATSNYSAKDNWNGNTPIAPGDTLIFPTGLALADKVTVHDYASSTLWESLRFDDGGYSLSGNLMRISGGVRHTSTGTVTLQSGFQFTADQIFASEGGGTLQLTGSSSINLAGFSGGFTATLLSNILCQGPITNSGGGPTQIFTKNGIGTLTLSGTSSNTFPATFAINQGDVTLAKTVGATAINAGLIRIGNGSTNLLGSRLLLGNSNQIAPNNNLLIDRDGGFYLNGFNEILEGDITLNAPARIDTGAGLLTLHGDITLTTLYNFDGAATLQGRIRLAASPVITWNCNLAPNVGAIQNLICEAEIESSPVVQRLIKNGPGGLSLKGVSTVPLLEISDGRVQVDSNSPTMAVEMTSGTLVGKGTVGSVAATGIGTYIQAPSTAGEDLTIDGDLTLTSGTAFLAWVHNTLPIEISKIIINGDVTLNGAGFAFGYTPGMPTPPAGTEFVLLQNNGSKPIIGETSAGQGAVMVLPGGQQYIQNHFGGDGNDFALSAITTPTGVTRTWDGGGANADWTTPENWSPDGSPQPGDDLRFPIVALRKTNVNNFPAGTAFNNITVEGNLYNLGGALVVLQGQLTFTSANADNFINFPIKLGTDTAISITGSTNARALIQAGIDLNKMQLTLNNQSGGYGDIIMYSAITGQGRIAKTGSGPSSFLNYPHSYTGTTRISEGAIIIYNSVGLGASGPANHTTIEENGVLALENDIGVIATNETIILDGGTILERGAVNPATLSGTLEVLATGGTIQTHSVNAMSSTAVLIGPGNLTKTGNGGFTLAGTGPSTLGEIIVRQGNVNLQRLNGNVCTAGLTIGYQGSTASATLQTNHQLPDDGFLVLENPNTSFNAASFNEHIGTITMNGGTLTGSAPGLLTFDSLTTVANAATANIQARIGTPPSDTAELIIADGSATTDAQFTGEIFGGTMVKKGTGRADIPTDIPSGGLLGFDLQAGSLILLSNCQHTSITLNGGLLGGNGTVGSITSDSGGIISPGTSPGVLGGAKATWDPATNLRIEIDGPNPGSGYDQYFANSFSDLGGAILTLTGTYDPAPGEEFMIVRNVSGDPLVGTFTNAPEGGYVSAPGAKIFQITYIGGDGDDVVLTRIATVAPETIEYSFTPGPNPGDDLDAHLVFKGLPGLTYTLQTSTTLNVNDWQNILTPLAEFPDGLITLDLLEPASEPRKFYRLMLP